jgi:hypothetical protein
MDFREAPMGAAFFQASKIAEREEEEIISCMLSAKSTAVGIRSP